MENSGGKWSRFVSYFFFFSEENEQCTTISQFWRKMTAMYGQAYYWFTHDFQSGRARGGTSFVSCDAAIVSGVFRRRFSQRKQRSQFVQPLHFETVAVSRVRQSTAVDGPREVHRRISGRRGTQDFRRSPFV